MSSDFLFGRVLTVTVTSSDPSVLVKLNGFDTALNEGFDIDAHVIKDSEPNPNKCVMRLMNLPEDQRHAFQSPGCKFDISAGYSQAGTVASLGVFDVRKVHHEVEEADWVTHIEAAESSALVDALVNISFGPGQTLASLAKQVAQPLLNAGIGIGNFSTTLGTSQLTYPNGACFAGRARDRLKALALKAGWEFSVQHGELFFSKPGSGDPSRIVRLSADTGLISLPVPGEADEKKKKKPQVKVKSLLQPSITPKGYVFVDIPIGTGGAQGQLLVKKVDHNVSTYAQPFYSEMECEVPS